jgi:hypothetical protein
MSEFIIPTFLLRPVNPDDYALGTDELAFFKQETGIKDDADLKEHILAVLVEGYEVRTR